MPVFGKGEAAPNPLPRVPALVIAAEAPPEGTTLLLFSPLSWCDVRILVDYGLGPMQVVGRYKASEDHWLVRGQDIFVFIDGTNPGAFEVDWSVVPSMEARAVAGDPTLVDPLGVARRVAQALGPTNENTGTARADRFAALMAQAASAPAPSGWAQCVVIVSTIRGRVVTEGSENNPSRSVKTDRSSATVLSVNIPGRQPYAVYLRKWHYEKDRRDLVGAGMPALVSESDPTEIRIYWDQVPSLRSLVSALTGGASNAQLMAQGLRKAAGLLGGGRPVRGYQPMVVGQPVPQATQPPTVEQVLVLPPEVRAVQVEQLRQWARTIPDPALRQQWIAYYGAGGLDISG